MSKKDWYWFTGMLLGIMASLSTGHLIALLLCAASLASMALSFFADDTLDIEVNVSYERTDEQAKLAEDYDTLLTLVKKLIAEQESERV